MALLMKNSKAPTTTTCIKSSAIAKPVVTLGIPIKGLINESKPKTIAMMVNSLKPFVVYFSNKKNTKEAIKVGIILEINTGTIYDLRFMIYDLRFTIYVLEFRI